MPADRHRPVTPQGKKFLRSLAAQKGAETRRGTGGGGAYRNTFQIISSDPTGVSWTDLPGGEFTIGGVIACIEGWLEHALASGEDPRFVASLDISVFYEGRVCAVLKRAGRTFDVTRFEVPGVE